MTRDGQATAPVAPLADEAADRSGQQRERRNRGERIHHQGDRGLLVVAGDRRHQVNSQRLLGAEPRRQTPGRRRDWQAAQAALERLAGWGRSRDHRGRHADRVRPGRSLGRDQGRQERDGR